MRLRGKRKELQGVVGAIGVVVGLVGFVGGYISVRLTLVLMFGIWILGAVLVNLFTDP